MSRSVSQSWKALLSIVLGAGLMVGTLLLASVHYRNSDPMYVSAVTHRLLTEGRVDLEGFEQLERIHPGHRIRMHEQVPYHYYPLGAVVGQIPGVLLAKLLGEMPHDIDAEVQLWNSIFALVLSWFLLVMTCRRISGDSALLVVGFFLFLTGPIVGSLGTTFWSTTPAVLLYFAILFFWVTLLARRELSRGQQLGFGFLLAAVVFVRPTCLAATLPALLLIFLLQRAALLRVGCSWLLSFLAWLTFSRFLYGTFLPPYFSAHGEGTFQPLQALGGLLFSPGRGFFVYAPVFVLTALGVFGAWRRLENRTERHVWLLLALWIGLHWVGTALFAPDWWGGWCYGPRLLAETVPIWIVLSLLVLKRIPLRRWPLLRVSLMALWVWGAYVNLIQGQFNSYTNAWNESISIKHHPKVLWDWEYPPFFNSKARHNDRLDKYGITHF